MGSEKTGLPYLNLATSKNSPNHQIKIHTNISICSIHLFCGMAQKLARILIDWPHSNI